ncbi:RND transporter [Bradymonas sediminis]|uniref:RND transporter n=1 Tax=Bradymonas sediminis TaxID=1548548 RepID=A0A2Z4FIB8_9DELT|nr:RND transporter [Bradymonas sediminis]AWV88555.1 RND transporter [Bradymonas sediminis]TDP77695.1 hypothetical protein DFR33_101606 [Bradymonas sediminis]
MIAWIRNLSWTYVILACLTLGLAPFIPPHIFEKLGMLFDGQLARPIDIFDLFFHGAPWLLLLWKAGDTLVARAKKS